MTIMNMVGGGGGGDLVPKNVSYVYSSAPVIETSYFHAAHTPVNTSYSNGYYTYGNPATYATVYYGKIFTYFNSYSKGFYRGTVTDTTKIISNSNLSSSFTLSDIAAAELNDSGKVVFALSMYAYGGATIKTTTDHPMVTLEGSFTKTDNVVTVTAPIAGKSIGDLFGEYPYMYDSSSSQLTTSNMVMTLTIMSLENE